MANTKITTRVIADDAITSAQIADNAINSEHYVDGSIDTAHIANGQVTVDKMAANSIDSAQYVDGSIDTAHYADNSITGAELADNIDIAGTLDVTGATTLDSTLSVAGVLTGASLDISGNIDVDGVTNLDVVDIDGAVNMATTLTVVGAITAPTGTSIGQAAFSSNILESNNTGNAGARIRLAVSSSANPTYSFQDDTNTGMFTSGADTLNFTTGGTQRLIIDNAGFLDYAATGNDIARFSGANSGGLTIRNDTANQLILHTGTSDALVFGTGGNNDRMTITSAGNVGIGRAAPASIFEVHMATNKNIGFSGGQGELGSVPALVAYNDAGALADIGLRGASVAFATASQSRMEIHENLVVINEGGFDSDFRVESEDNTHMLFVDGGQNAIGINATSLGADIPLTIMNEAHVSDFSKVCLGIGGTEADDAVGVKSSIGFGYVSAARPIMPAVISYETKSTSGGTFGDLLFALRTDVGNTQPTERVRITSAGNVGFNTTGTDAGSNASSQVSTSTPNRFVFNNNYSNGYTDASLKLYLFNSQGTRQGFTSGPAYDIQYHTSGNASGRHAFYVANTEEVRIDQHGIKFHGDTAAANALGDYEEGTWTPTSGINLTVNTTCRYIKIGKHLTVTFDITFASNSDGNSAAIGSIPFSYTTYNSGFTGWQNTGSGVQFHVAGTTAFVYNSISNAVFTYGAVSGKRLIGTITGIVA